MKNKYNVSNLKRFVDVSFCILFLTLGFPLFAVISCIVLITSGTPIFFKQKRIGKNGRVFVIYKFRTMRLGADKENGKLLKYNEADGPVFKIRNDPRFTKIGKILSRTGLDELPQMLNVIKGDMSFVGPRPLPVDEAKKLTKNQNLRHVVKPGLTSSWVVNGSHNLTFDEWMKLDLDYVKNATFIKDLYILFGTTALVIKSSIQVFKR